MVDQAEIRQGVDPIPATLCVDGEGWRHSSATPWDPVSKVLEDGDLLREIMVRLGFPTSLVRATLVCKRWLCHASDPSFLRRFRKHNPPRLLGFYINTTSKRNPPFVPMPQPPELGAVIRHASFNLYTYSNQSLWTRVMDCWGGNVFLGLQMYKFRAGTTCAVHRPLWADMTILPPFPWHQMQNINMPVGELLFKEEDSLSYLWMESTTEKATMHIYSVEA